MPRKPVSGKGYLFFLTIFLMRNRQYIIGMNNAAHFLTHFGLNIFNFSMIEYYPGLHSQLFYTTVYLQRTI